MHQSNGIAKHDSTEFTAQKISDDTHRLVKSLASKKELFGMFCARTANEVLNDAKSQPEPNRLYDELIVENEVILIFADTGVGKTVFAMQAAEFIARSRKVGYVDLELSDKQFEKRTRNEDGKNYTFSPNFYRLDMSDEFEIPYGIDFVDFFIESLIKAADAIGTKILFIDNLTKLAAGDTDGAKDSIRIMEKLHKLKRMGFTIVAIEHNKKVIEWQPISLNHLQGSKMKPNFADAVFSIGRSQKDKYIRYVKQLKVRSAEMVYDTENVKEYEIGMHEGLLSFKPIGYGSEYAHLKTPGEESKSEMLEAVKTMKAKGISNVQIARQLGITEGTVRNWLKNSEQS